MDELLHLLKENFSSLSEGQKKVARAIFENPGAVAFTPAFEIGRKVGVSESTVIRLSQSLGYKGYAELQDIARKSLENARTLSQHREIKRIQQEQPVFQELMKDDIRNIQRMTETIDNQDFELAIQLISRAERIFVTGSFASYGLACFLTHWFRLLLQNTEMLVENDHQYCIQLAQVNENSLLIPIIFPRYCQSTLNIAKQAKQRGGKVLAISDSTLSPIARYSDVVLTSPIHSELRVDSYTAPLSLIGSLIRTVTIEEEERTKENLERIEKIYQANQIFYKESKE